MNTDKLHLSTHLCRSPEETQALAERLGRLLQGGECLALEGDLGAGKTCFVQGLAKGLDVPEDVYVRSPTFALLDEYPGRIPLFHLDLYRLEDEDELEAIGWRDCLRPDAVVAVEWSNRIPDALPPDKLIIELTLPNETNPDAATHRELKLYLPQHLHTALNI